MLIYLLLLLQIIGWLVHNLALSPCHGGIYRRVPFCCQIDLKNDSVTVGCNIFEVRLLWLLWLLWLGGTFFATPLKLGWQRCNFRLNLFVEGPLLLAGVCRNKIEGTVGITGRIVAIIHSK